MPLSSQRNGLPAAAGRFLLALVPAILLACSGAASRPAGGPGQVGVAVASPQAGVTLLRDAVSAATILRAVEIDGRGFSLSWSGVAAVPDSALWAFQHCLDYGPVFRPQGRRTPPAWRQAGLVRTETFRCIGVAGLPQAPESALPAPDAFDVWLGVTAPDIGAEPGNPLWSSGASTLGGMRLVRKAGVGELSVVTADARACRDVAQQGGAIDSYQSPIPGNSTDPFLQTYMVSAAGLLGRFDRCMSQRGYELQAPPDESEQTGWGPAGSEVMFQPRSPEDAKRAPGAFPVPP